MSTRSTFLPSASSYDVQTYLLDKWRLTDLTNQVALGFDGDHALLRDRVYTPVIELDYSRILGDAHRTYTIDEWLVRLTEVHRGWTHLQHVFSNVLIDLPSPSPSAQRPTVVTGSAYVHGIFYNDDEEGRPRKMMKKNGGRHQLEFVRIEELEAQGQNPWRLRKQIGELDWQEIGSE